MDALETDLAPAGIDRELLALELDDQYFKLLPFEFLEAGACDELFELIEQDGYLIEQADHFHGFGPSSQTVEKALLPAAIARQDWTRLLQYALVALNLRGLAATLAGEGILEALVKGGHGELAADIARQLADRSSRARALAVVAAFLPPGSAPREDLQRQVAADLDALPAEALPETLVAVAGRLGPDLEPRWDAWIGRLSDHPEPARRAWQEVAAAWIERQGWEVPGLWRALAGAGGVEDLLAFLPARLASVAAQVPMELLDRLRTLAGDSRPFWHTCAAVLGKRAADGDGEVPALWQRLTSASPVPWTPLLVETGRELWPRLSTAWIDAVAREIQDPITRAAFLVLALGDPAEPARTEAALQVVDEIPNGVEKLRWGLRCLGKMSHQLRADRVESVARHLHDLRYSAQALDLAAFLDLVASSLSRAELARQIDGVAWSPASGPQTLRTLAAACQERPVLERLLDHAEGYAAAVASSEPEGFELRRELLIAVAARLCDLTGELAWLERACERLVPEEEEAARAAVVDALAAGQRPRLARCVARQIGDLRLRLLAELNAFPAGELPADRLQPRALYAAAAGAAAIEDERLALDVLLEEPREPRQAARILGRVRDPGRRILGFIDLAWHALAFERLAFRPSLRDRLAALLPLREALPEIPSDECLIALTPVLAELGARVSPTRATAEVKEAMSRLIREEVDSPQRQDALETLLARIGPAFLPDEPMTDREAFSRCRRAVAVLDWAAELPASEQAGTGRERLPRDWPRFVACLTAASESLPPVVQAYRSHPLRSRLCLEWFPRLTLRFGIERTWAVFARLESLVPRTLRRGAGRRRGPRATMAEFGRAAPHHEVAGDLGERLGRTDELERATEPPPDEVEAMAYLLAASAPERVPVLLRRLCAGVARDDLCLRLVRHRWLRGEAAEEVLGLIEDQVTGWQAEAWLALAEGPDERFLQAIEALVARGRLDPWDPRNVRIRRRLWELGQAGACPALARSIAPALVTGGRRTGEWALLLWLGAFLAPRWGWASADRDGIRQVDTATKRARSLAGQD